MIHLLEPPLAAPPPGRLFDEALLALWAAASTARQPLALLLADVDGLAAYRAVRGPTAGDLTHQVIAVALAEACPGGAWVRRRGATGLALLLPATALTAACDIAEDARRAVHALRVPTPDPRRAHLTLSVGASAASPSPGVRPWPVDLLEAAEAALLHARAGGMDRVVARAIEPVDPVRRPSHSPPATRHAPQTLCSSRSDISLR